MVPLIVATLFAILINSGRSTRRGWTQEMTKELGITIVLSLLLIFVIFPLFIHFEIPAKIYSRYFPSTVAVTKKVEKLSLTTCFRQHPSIPFIPHLFFDCKLQCEMKETPLVFNRF